MERLAWVRIKRRGKNKNRLVLVKKIDNATAVVTVLIAGCLERNKKRKRGHKEVAVGGFYELELPLMEVSGDGVYPSHEELSQFMESHDPIALAALKKLRTTLQVDDRVQIITGSHVGIEGRVESIDNNNRIVSIIKTNSIDSVEVPISDVRKKFQLGDYVKILHGLREGDEGFITAIDEECADIYIAKASEEVRAESIALVYLITSQFRAGLLQLGWTAPPTKLVATTSQTPTDFYSTGICTSDMYTGDPYVHMEIKVTAGSNKGLFATVIASAETNGNVVLIVVFEAKPNVMAVTVDVKDAVERL